MFNNAASSFNLLSAGHCPHCHCKSLSSVLMQVSEWRETLCLFVVVVYKFRFVAFRLIKVLEEEKCEEDVFALAVNYMDRVLASIPIRKTMLQLLGAVCMFIASKFKNTFALTADRLVMYTDFSITVDQLLVSQFILSSDFCIRLWSLVYPAM